MTTKRQNEERYMTINVLCAEVNAQTTNTLSLRDIEVLVDRLHRHERTLNRIYTVMCERELTPQEENKLTSTKSNVVNIFKAFQIPVNFNQDPRGGAIRFILSSGRSNNMGGEDWGIFW